MPKVDTHPITAIATSTSGVCQTYRSLRPDSNRRRRTLFGMASSGGGPQFAVAHQQQPDDDRPVAQTVQDEAQAVPTSAMSMPADGRADYARPVEDRPS